MGKRSYRNGLKSELFDEAYRLRHEEGKSYPAIAKILGVYSSTVYTWLANFAGEEKNCKQETMEQNQEKSENVKPEEYQHFDMSELDNCSLEEQVAKLKAALRVSESSRAREKVRADLNEEIIKIAEAKFNIKIRKKLAPSSKRPARKGRRPISS